MRMLWSCLVMLMVLPVHADIFKCTINGNTEFSDQPCSKDAQTIELRHQKPDSKAIEQQQAITATFEEESRVNRIHRLNQKNDDLEAEIMALEERRRTELDQLRTKTYITDDGRIVSTEHGLFQKMDDVNAAYQQQIDQRKQQIAENKHSLTSLYRQAPKQQ